MSAQPAHYIMNIFRYKNIVFILFTIQFLRFTPNTLPLICIGASIEYSLKLAV